MSAAVTAAATEKARRPLRERLGFSHARRMGRFLSSVAAGWIRPPPGGSCG